MYPSAVCTSSCARIHSRSVQLVHDPCGLRNVVAIVRYISSKAQIYMECDAYFELTKRQRNHGPFCDALSAVRVGKPTASDIRYLDSRHDRTLKSDAGGRWADSTVIVGTNKEVHAYNDAALLRDCSQLNDKRQVKRTARWWTHVTVGKESDGFRERMQLE